MERHHLYQRTSLTLVKQLKMIVGSSVVGLAFVVMFVIGCSQQTQSPRTRTTTTPGGASSTPVPGFPAFADWRATYLGADGRLHAVSLNGKSDVAGPVVPGLTIHGLTFSDGGIAPNGHMFLNFAYGLDLINVAGGSPTRHYDHFIVYDAAWQQDSSKVALSDRTGNFWIMNAASGSPIPIPGGTHPNITRLDGWLDASHLVLDGADLSQSYRAQDGNTFPTKFILYSLDVTSGALRPIATIFDQGVGFPNFKLSPDGSEAFFFNAPFRDYIYYAQADEVDTATGEIHPLPNIATILSRPFSSLTWRPGSQTLFGTQGWLVNGDLQGWNFNLQVDTANKIPLSGYAEGWDPDGSTLVISDGQQIGIGNGPYTISAVTFGANGPTTVTPLTHGAMTFPFIGFSRTSP